MASTALQRRSELSQTRTSGATACFFCFGGLHIATYCTGLCTTYCKRKSTSLHSAPTSNISWQPLALETAASSLLMLTRSDSHRSHTLNPAASSPDARGNLGVGKGKGDNFIRNHHVNTTSFGLFPAHPVVLLTLQAQVLTQNRLRPVFDHQSSDIRTRYSPVTQRVSAVKH